MSPSFLGTLVLRELKMSDFLPGNTAPLLYEVAIPTITFPQTWRSAFSLRQTSPNHEVTGAD